MPRVSVVIPSHNCGHTVGRAIDSVLAQTYQDFEIMVVDDASTDNTGQIVSGYGERVRYLRRGKNGGAGRARAN
jgi:glycosyltransferase involved in cell wall biosynthesis